ncbi:unnamed protein product, partial [Cyprideis torosa]
MGEDDLTHLDEILELHDLEMDKPAGVKGKDARQMLNPQKTLKKEPLLYNDDLIGSGYYAEYRTDDARLTIENIKKAGEYGAVAKNYHKVTGFLFNDGGRISGVTVHNEIDKTDSHFFAHTVISAAGPWVDDLARLDRPTFKSKLLLSKGVHVVFPHAKLPVRQSIYFDVSDGRMVFAIPRNQITYVGTTDTFYHGDLNDISCTTEDAEYLLKAVNEQFDIPHLGLEDIISTWAGLRPLIKEEGKNASEVSRKDEMFESETGLITIAGGRLYFEPTSVVDYMDVVIEEMQAHHGWSAER